MILKILTVMIVLFIIIGAFLLGVMSGIWLADDSADLKAPADYINESQIHFYEDKVCIDVANATIGRYAGTGSMIPVLNEYSNGIKVPVTNESDVHEGDIITYDDSNCTSLEDCANNLIIHRVIKIMKTEKGTFYMVKGDANQMADRIVPFSEIRYKTVAIIYLSGILIRNI